MFNSYLELPEGMKKITIKSHPRKTESLLKLTLQNGQRNLMLPAILHVGELSEFLVVDSVSKMIFAYFWGDLGATNPHDSIYDSHDFLSSEGNKTSPWSTAHRAASALRCLRKMAKAFRSLGSGAGRPKGSEARSQWHAIWLIWWSQQQTWWLNGDLMVT